MGDTPRLYSNAEVAIALGVSPAHVRRMAGRLNLGLMIAGVRLFTAGDLDRLRARDTKRGPKFHATQSPIIGMDESYN